MELLEVFATVVEQHSLNRASQMLSVSQPALSRKIKSLEEKLDVPLFDRKGKRLELTRAGQICYEYAVEIRQLNHGLLQEIQRFKADHTSFQFILGASLTTLQSTMPDLITHFTQSYPHADIQALTGKTHEIVQMVREQKVDIGLVASTIDQPGIHCLPLFNDHLCLVLPADFSDSARTFQHIHDIHSLPMILFSRGTWYRILTDELFHRYAIFPNVKMEIDSFEAILRLVNTCQVATLLPMSYLRRSLLINNELIIKNIPELEATTRRTSLIYVEQALQKDSVRAFIEKTKQLFPEAYAPAP